MGSGVGVSRRPSLVDGRLTSAGESSSGSSGGVVGIGDEVRGLEATLIVLGARYAGV